MRHLARVLAAVTALVASAACGGSGDGDDRRPSALGGGNAVEAAPSSQITTTTRVQVIRDASDGTFDPEAIYKADGPGVVTVVSVFGEAGLDSLLNGGGGGGGGGLGSGFVLNGEGEIATNAHVVTQGDGRAVKRARQVFVEFADGNQVEAKIVGDDPNADIALLRLNPKGLDLHPLPLASADEIEVGSPVVALGSPFGEKQSLSVGVVSALDRNIASLTSFQISGAVQTDAAINPGNSGGPLLNAAGHVVGINQQIKSNSGGGEGVGFAVPADVVRRSLARLREDGTAEYAYLGVSSVGLYPQLVREFDLPVKAGAWLQTISPDGPGEKAGLEGGDAKRQFQARQFEVGGDIVIGVEDTPVRDPDDLSAAISRYRPGQKVSVQVYRGREKRDIEVILGERPLAPSSRTG